MPLIPRAPQLPRGRRILVPLLMLTLLAGGCQPRPAEPVSSERAPTAAPKSADATAVKPTGSAPRIYLGVQTANPTNEDPLRGSAILAIDPQTGAWEVVVTKAAEPRASVGGKTLAYVGPGGMTARLAGGTTRVITPGRHVPILSGDGTEVLYSATRGRRGDGARTLESYRLPVAGGEPAKLPIPDTDSVADFSPDGQWLLTLSDRHMPVEPSHQLYVMRADGKEPRRLSVVQGPGSPGVFLAARFSPDGQRVACLHQKQGNQFGVWVVDRDGKNARQVVAYNPQSHPTPCWSPDGRRLALADHDFTPDGQPTRYHLDVIDVDGGNRRTLPTPPVVRMGAPDWR